MFIFSILFRLFASMPTAALWLCVGLSSVFSEVSFQNCPAFILRVL